MPLIGKNTIKNARSSNSLIKIGLPLFSDIKDGVIVRIVNRTDRGLYLAVEFGNLSDTMKSYILESYNKKDILFFTYQKDNDSKFSYWNSIGFKQHFPRHKNFVHVTIDDVWKTNIKTKGLTSERLNDILTEVAESLKRKRVV